MNTSKKIGGMILAVATVASLAACTYHERTVVERPVAAPATVVVPESRPSTVVVPEQRPNTVIVPEGSAVVVPPPAQ